MDLFTRILARFKYRIRSRSKFSIHSPFVYNLVVNVFEDHTEYSPYAQIENRKRQLIADKRSILRTDLGAKQKTSDIPEKVRSIVKNQSVSRKNGKLLFRIAQKYKPAGILELGTSFGLSTSYLASACRESKMITVEGCPETAAVARETFSLMHLENIELITGNFDVILPEVLKKMQSSDLIFIDGNHRKDNVLDYFRQLLPSVRNETIIIFDDIHWSKEMEAAWKEICHHEKVKITIDLFQFGLVFFKKELSKEDFVIRYS